MERRLTIILAADVVGYSRLMGQDEAGTLAALKALRRGLVKPKETQYRGRTVKLMSDGALVEFASAVDALGFAVEVQAAMAERNAGLPAARRIAYRLGLAMGDLVAAGDEVSGEGVSLAEQLDTFSEPGGIAIAQSVYDRVKDRLDLTFERLDERAVEATGEPVPIYRVVLDDKAAALITPVVEPPAPARPNRWPAIAASFVLSLVGIAGLVWLQPWVPEIEPASVARMAFPLPAKPSLAVLPFANLSGDGAQDYFADGMTEDLIADLSRFSGLFVIARNSAFAYKDQEVPARQVAEDLGVRYLLEGGVRRVGDAVRIDARLVDATTGGEVWAERYDGAMTDLFDLRDQVTRQIVAALEVRPSDEEASRTETLSPEAYDAFLQGRALDRRVSVGGAAEAIPHFETAIELDPGFGRAYAALAALYWQGLRQARTSKLDPEATEESPFGGARAQADKFAELALAKPTPLAHRVASARSWDGRRFADAIAEAREAVRLDPNDPDGHVALAWALIFDGSYQDALDSVSRAMRLDPLLPGDYSLVLGAARLGLGDYEAAVAALEPVNERTPEARNVDLALAAAYSHLDRPAEAEAALKRYREWSVFAAKVDEVLGWWPFKQERDIRRFGGGLIRAGLCCEEVLDDYVEQLRAGGTLQ